MTAFGDAWLADVKAKQPTQYGPQPAPSGTRPGGVGRVGRRREPIPWPRAVPPRHPRRAPAASVAPGAATDTVADVPAWMAPLVAGIGVIVVVVLVLAARRNQAPDQRP